jgi:GDPmannose 4,6-dehydratase
MERILPADEPADHVLATGASYMVGDLVRLAFEPAGLDEQDHACFDLRDLRPTEVDDLIGDASQA